MAVMRLKSLSEDTVDAYSHTVAPLFFLFLGLLLLVVSSRPGSDTTDNPYSVACWCPAQFEHSQVGYANGLCQAALHTMIHGGNFSGAFIRFSNLDEEIPGDSIRKGLSEAEENIRKEIKEAVKRKTINGGAANLSIQPPVLLFLLTLCLRLPHLLWSILSRCTNSVNIHQTLIDIQNGTTLNNESRKELYTNLMKAMQKSVKKCRSKSTFLYLLMKATMVAVIVAEIAIIAELQVFNRQDQVNELEAGRGDSASPLEENPIFHCSFYIRQLTLVHDYTVQCVAKQLEAAATHAQSFLTSVHQLVLPALVVLLVANVISLVTWVFNTFVHTCCAPLGIQATTPLDLALLLRMAQNNLGVRVAAGLADAVRLNHIGEEQKDLELIEK